MKILFVSYAFPPISSPGSMRIFNFAKYLSKHSEYNIDVLYCRNGYSSMIDNERNWDFDNINLISVPDLIPKINNLAVKNNTKKTKKSLFKKLKFKLVKQLNKLVFPDRNIGWALNSIKKNILKKKYDYIISSYPSITNLILGHYYSNLLKIPHIVDLRDLWTQDSQFSNKNKIKQFIEKKIEHRILCNSYLILTVSNYNAKVLSKKYGEKVEVIFNGYENENFNTIQLTTLETKKTTVSNKFKMAYAGSFYNGERNVNMLFEAIRSLKSKKIINSSNFCFDIYGNEEDYIINLIKKYEVSNLVKVRGLINQNALFNELATYDLLLVVTRQTPISKGELTTKVFEYIALRNPILCLSKLDYEIVDVLKNMDYTYCVDLEDKTTIENSLIQIIKHSKNSPKRKAGMEFSRDAMSEKLKCLLEANNYHI